MRTETVTDSATLNPSNYDNVSTYSTNSISSGYAASSSTTYSTIYLTRGKEAETVFYYKFTSPSIPSNATINSITCSVKVYNNTSSSYVATKTVQLCTGTTTKGSASGIPASTTAFDMTCGSWTASETNDIRLKLYAQRTSSNQNTSYYIRFYGATLTINYTVVNTYYTVSVTNTSSATVTPVGNTEYLAGEQNILTVDGDINKIRVYDNSVCVNEDMISIPQYYTSQVTSVTYSGNTSSSGISSANAVIGRDENSTMSNTEIYANDTSSTANYYFHFDFSHVPSSIVATGITVRMLCKATAADDQSFSYYLRNGTTTISSVFYLTSTTKSIKEIFINSASLSNTVYQNLNMMVEVAYNGGYIYGMTAYVYTGYSGGYSLFSTLSADHTITVEDYVLFLKQYGGWWNVAKVWKKTNGTWSVDWGYTFSQTTKYLHAKSLAYDSEVEYLESTGTQYIDLPLSVPAGTYMDVVFTAICLHPNNNNYGLWGTYPQNQFSSWFYSYNSETNFSLMSTMVGTQSTNGGYNLRVGKPSTVKISTTGVTEYNGTFTSLNRPLTSDVTSLRIFGVTESNNRYPIRISMFRVHVGDELVYDLIPVRIGNKGYFYDLISRVLFGNAGTGDFVLGGDKPCVAYLESTGTQYIDTGIVPDADTGILVKAMSSNSTDTYLAGLREDGNNTRWCIGHSGANTQYYYGYGNWATGGSSYTSMSVIARLNYNNINKFAISEFDGSSQMNVALPALPFTPARSIYIFGANYYAESGVARWSGRIYSAQITQDNVLVRDFVPTSVNGIGYMYDKVTKQLYGNSGTGNFIIGTDRIEKPYDAEVEYIKSSGTEYIDTGYIPTANTHIIMRAAYKNNNYTDNMNGEMESSTNRRFHWGVVNNTNENTLYYHFACGSKYGDIAQIPFDNNIHTFELFGSGECKIDASSFAMSSGELTYTVSKSLTLFARNDASSVGKFINDMELYYFQIYESDALVMDFIPVRVGVTSYLYDKIGKRLYGNLGTGYLTHGDDIAL